MEVSRRGIVFVVPFEGGNKRKMTSSFEISVFFETWSESKLVKW